jgi:hypothetical protein
MFDLVRGLVTSPWLVGIARGLVTAVVSAAVLFLIGALSGTDVPAALVPFVPIQIAILRSIEGAIDQADPLKPS